MKWITTLSSGIGIFQDKVSAGKLLGQHFPMCTALEVYMCVVICDQVL